jgi:hypothetical protein
MSCSQYFINYNSLQNVSQPGSRIHVLFGAMKSPASIDTLLKFKQNHKGQAIANRKKRKLIAQAEWGIY